MNVRRAETEHRFLASREQADAFLARVVPHSSLEVYDPRNPIAYTRTTYLDTDHSQPLAALASAVLEQPT